MIPATNSSIAMATHAKLVVAPAPRRPGDAPGLVPRARHCPEVRIDRGRPLLQSHPSASVVPRGYEERDIDGVARPEDGRWWLILCPQFPARIGPNATEFRRVRSSGAVCVRYGDERRVCHPGPTKQRVTALAILGRSGCSRWFLWARRSESGKGIAANR
jgi:hypothetical protein